MMKTKCLALLLVVLSVAPGAAQSSARELFLRGLRQYRQRLWANAAQEFNASYRVQRHSMTALYLAATHSRMRHFDQTIAYAADALRERPRLGEPYATDARNLITWAQATTRARERLRLRFEMAEANGSQGRDIIADVAEEEEEITFLRDLGISRSAYVEEFERIMHAAEIICSQGGPMGDQACLRALQDESYLPLAPSITDAPETSGP